MWLSDPAGGAMPTNALPDQLQPNSLASKAVIEGCLAN